MAKKKKKKGIFKGKFLKKPKAKIEKVSPEKFVTKGLTKTPLVKEGRTGYFSDEYEKEIKWLK